MRKQSQQGRSRRGQIIPRGTKRYLVRMYLGRSATGQRRYMAKVVVGTRAAANREVTKMLREKDKGTLVEPSKRTLGQWIETWLKEWVRNHVADRTFEDYRTRLSRDVVPELGQRRLDQLTPVDIQGLYTRLQARDLSAISIRYTHATLKMALKQAVRINLLYRNPADLVKPPNKTRREVQVLTSEQVGLFLEATKDEPLHALWAVLFFGGLRPGEAFGLKWDDLRGDTLHIQRALKKGLGDTYFLDEPKTSQSRRAVTLPKAAIEALKAHRVRQAERALAVGPHYRRNNLIFPNQAGNFLDIAKVRRTFQQALKRSGLPKIRLYDTRHTHATLLLHAGENAKSVSLRLGHTTVAMTLDTYTHILPNMQQETVARLERYMAKAAASA